MVFPTVSGDAMLLSIRKHYPLSARTTLSVRAPLFARTKRGFTLIELLVVMVVIGILLSIVSPRYFNSVSKAEEAVLKQNLLLMRDALDKYQADSGRYPDSLDDLVSKKYLRNIPYDPVAKSSETWVLVAPEDVSKGLVFDVKSGATGIARDGTPYSDW